MQFSASRSTIRYQFVRCIVFCECYGDHRDLLSFPTRRSSDLWAGPIGSPRIGRVDEADGVDVADERSEEHTSELQSRGHLVCRLLLEKKKKLYTLSGPVTNGTRRRQTGSDRARS